MMNRTLALRVVSVAVGGLIASSAFALHDGPVSFTFSDVNDSTILSGSGTVQAHVDGSGNLVAVSGTASVTGSALGTLSLTLQPNPSAPNQITTPGGQFYIDNLLLPNASPTLTNAGLWFAVDGSPNANDYVNIYSNSSAPNTLYAVLRDNTTDGALTGDYNVVFTADYSAVPEATTVMLGLAATMPILSGRRRQRA